MALETRLLDCRTASAYLGTSEAGLRMRIHRGQLPKKVIKRLGSRVYLDKIALDRFLDGEGGNGQDSRGPRTERIIDQTVKETMDRL